MIDVREMTTDELLALRDSLLVYRLSPAGVVEPFILVDGRGAIFGFSGHVDLGTGIRTSLGQIVAEEFDLTTNRVTMILGDSARTPDQGATIASDTIQTTAVPLRKAAAQARLRLHALAAETLGIDPQDVISDDGTFSARSNNMRLGFGDLLRGRQEHLELDMDTPVKAVENYRLVGTSSVRVDLMPKLTGELVFVHDMRVPGMLHGRVIRPPYAGVDAGDFVGKSLLRVDRDSISHIPGVVDIVTIGDFIGVVAEREEHAIAAAQALKVEWKPVPSLRSMADLEQALRENPCESRRLQDKGDVERAIADATHHMPRTYVWPYQMHASIGPSCALAHWTVEGLAVWSGTQNPNSLRADLALLLDMPTERIDLVRMEAAGCYGRNCADDVTADAALLSRVVGKPVRVQLSREQEHLWEPKGAAQLMEVDGALDAAGDAIAYDFQSRYPSNGATTLALLLTGKKPATADVWQMGDRTSIAPYDIPNMRVTIHDTPPIVRASWLRGVSALPNSFAHESWIDEAAAMAGVDPVEYRLRYLRDTRGIAVVEATAERARWQTHTTPGGLGGKGDILFGRGFAYALYVHSKFPGYGAAWAAWVADVSVNVRTGDIRVDKVTVGHDAGLMINPDGVQHQIHGNVIQSTSRALKEVVRFEPSGVAAAEWGAYPIITFPEVPEIDVLMLPRPDQPPLGVGESASVPSAAAIANAVYDATGIRLRDPPFTPEKVLRALREAGRLPAPIEEKGAIQPSRPGGLWSRAGAFLAGAMALAMTAAPWRPEIAPIARPGAGTYSAATIEKGRQLAALGDCAVCHTAPGGATNTGGLAMETPFGTIYTTNITPDEATGIGNWSYPAFERAMREGVHRDGRKLYPAFPYTAFTRTSDADLQALYAYLMNQKPVRQANRPNALSFPFSLRPLMAGWNALFLRPGAYRDDPSRSAEWNRGAYLVEGLGHCSACHSPRNSLGAEKTGKAYLTGGEAHGWDAPSLTDTSRAPLGWSRQDFYDYLRTGRSVGHGTAAGPMAPVIEELRALPDSDIKAMAEYLASFSKAGDEDMRRQIVAQATPSSTGTGTSPTARLYEAACAACHDASAGGYLMAAVPLGLSSKLHARRPDNLIRVILDGVPAAHASQEVHGMTGFRDSLTDRQIAGLARYLQSRFAPSRRAWSVESDHVLKIRAEKTMY